MYKRLKEQSDFLQKLFGKGKKKGKAKSDTAKDKAKIAKNLAKIFDPKRIED